MSHAIPCTVHAWGKTSFVITLDKQLRQQMGLVRKDVIAFRVIEVQGRRLMIGEKIPLHALANFKELPVEALEKATAKNAAR
jgi:hypothetical protein